ncbi:MAG: DUF459 domain-containing protein [Actinomycetia bacterium]|nr:DUF459 domain-containing protein [Actinomycetes bacterium]
MPPLPPPPTIETASAPGVSPRTARTSGRGALLQIILALLVGAGLSTDRLLGAAEHMAYGSSRSTMVAITEAAHASAVGVGLNQPGVVVDELMGRQPTQEMTATVDFLPFAAGPTTTTRPRPRPPLRSMRLPSVPAPLPVDMAIEPLDAAPTTTSTQAPERVMRPVAPSEKLRLWAGGDSLGEYVGNQLLFPISDDGLTDVQLSYHISTGLARPDYFDWLAEVQGLMDEPSPPEALVFMVGGNDDQNMLRDSEVLDVGSEPWYTEYRRRVATFMDTSSTISGSSHLYWIGLPPMREVRRETISVEINEILSAEADARPWVTFVDIYTLFTGPDGGFQAQLIDEEGKQRVARAPDGVHITFTGSTWVAYQVWGAIEDRWDLPEETTDGEPTPEAELNLDGPTEPGGLTGPGEPSGLRPTTPPVERGQPLVR